uniref:Uncharacterized protein n=1 Tax=Romanomermis culicivorax TaxID=13658 RepID=A0A915HIY7_ROMCU
MDNSASHYHGGTKDCQQRQVNVEPKGHRSTSVGYTVRQNLTFTIGDGPAYASLCPTYGSANSTASEKFDAVNDAIDACPECWRLPVRGTFTDVLLPWMLHPQRC